MKTNIEFVTGNFKLVVKGESIIIDEYAAAEGVVNPSREAAQTLNAAGMTYVVQRDVASAVYLELAGEVGKKPGSKTMPKFGPDGKSKWSRDMVAFSTDGAATFQLVAEEKLKSFGTFQIAVEQHVPGSGSALPMSMATEAWDKIMADPDPVKVEMRMELFGAPLNSTKEAQIQAIHAYLSGLRKK